MPDPVFAQAARRDQVMNVGMISQGARPGMQDTDHPQLTANITGIPGECLGRLRGDAEEQVVGQYLVSLSQRT